MFKNFKITPAMSFVFHSGVGLLVGGIVALVTSAGQAVFNTGANPQVVVGVGISAFLVSIGHSFVALKSNPQTLTAVTDFASELHTSPALVPDIEAFAKQIAPFLAGELMKIRTPPVSALQSQQRPVQNQQVNQQAQPQSTAYAPAMVPTAVMSGGAPAGWNNASSGGPAAQQQAQYWDMATQQVQNVPFPYSGHGG